MKISRKFAFAVLASTLVAAQAHSASLTLITLDDIEYRKPDKLVEMTQLNDADYQALLADNWDKVENTLQKYIPAGVDFAPPVPLAFYGPWKSCLTTRYPPACREHMTQLIALMESKAKTKTKEAAASPF